MKKIILLLFSITFSLILTAQESKSGFSFTGQVNSLFGKEAAILTFGGPGVSFNTGKLELSARFLPSLRCDTGKKLAQPDDSLRPVLGLGFQSRYKKLLLTAPALYFFENRWEFAAGIGVSLGVGKK